MPKTNLKELLTKDGNWKNFFMTLLGMLFVAVSISLMTWIRAENPRLDWFEPFAILLFFGAILGGIVYDNHLIHQRQLRKRQEELDNLAKWREESPLFGERE